jgi:hypothetical protein
MQIYPHLIPIISPFYHDLMLVGHQPVKAVNIQLQTRKIMVECRKISQNPIQNPI